MFRTLYKRVGDYKRDSLLTPLFAALEVFMEILIPFITAFIIDRGIEAGDMHNVLVFGALTLVCAFISLLCGIAAGRYASSAATGFAANLRRELFAAVENFSFSNIDKYGTAGLITRMTTDVTNVQNSYQMIIRIAVRCPLMLLCSMIMCFLINVRLSLVFLAALIFLTIVLFGIIFKVMPIFTEVFKKYDDLNASVQENVSGIRTVKSFVREDFEKEKFNRAAANLYTMFVKGESFIAFNAPVMMFAVYACLVALSWMGAHFIVEGGMTAGNLTSLFYYVINMLMSLMILSMVFVMITISTASAERIVEVLEERSDMANPEHPITEVADGSIDFNGVSFAYRHGSREDALHGIDLHIKSGETVGIIGATGCGKTTLISLISRFYDVIEGSVCVGGRDVRDYDIESLRRQVSVVLQKNVLFSGTILENLRWGREDASEEECAEACRLACADEFVEKMEEGYRTHIEQGGTNVSGGQRQRLCIARALLKKPKILILDDSTSAVDTATDAKIRRAFSERIPGTTTLIISQRISSVREADRILVMKDGSVDGFDSHDNLLKTNTIYREIYEAQVKGGGDFDSETN